MMDYQEGYCDGLSGAGMQDRIGVSLSDSAGWMDIAEFDDAIAYDKGFFAGSLDRKTMLHRETAYDRWADGLMNSTAGDVMQPVGVAGSEEYKAEQRAHNRNVSAQIDTLQRAGFVSDGDTWADGMGDGNG